MNDQKRGSSPNSPRAPHYDREPPRSSATLRLTCFPTSENSLPPLFVCSVPTLAGTGVSPDFTRQADRQCPAQLGSGLSAGFRLAARHTCSINTIAASPPAGFGRVQALCTFFQTYWLAQVGERALADMRRTTRTRAMIRLPMTFFFSNRRVGENLPADLPPIFRRFKAP